MVISRLNWLRLFILCLALTSLILGIVLRGRTDLYNDLIIIFLSDVLAFIMYIMAIRRSKNDDHSRLLGIGLRIAMSSFTLYVPAKAFIRCKFGVEQLWSVSRGNYYSEYIRCPELSYEEGERLRPTYDLLRAHCIVGLIVSLLMVVEMFSYWWSNEGSGRAFSREEADMELAAPIEMDMQNLSYSEQKIEMPDP
ncbi:hypothetical protein BGZ75_001992 [Mortierella antarctica]|nr:hypothetical protein BGZ75_001992 [Mortierella antarctica]